MGDAVLESERVDERLQRRARRADRVASCRRRRARSSRGNPARRHGRRTAPLALSMTIIAADSRGPSGRNALARERFEVRLKSRVDGEPVKTRVRRGAQRGFGGVGREHGQRPARLRHRLALRGMAARSRAFSAAEAATRASTRSRAARAACAKRSGRRSLRRLRQCDEKRCLRERQALRLLAEIGERGRAQPLQIAAIGREREVEVEDLGLAKRALDLHGAHRSGAAWRRASVPRAARAGARPAWSASSRRRRCARCEAPARAARASASESTPGWLIEAAVLDRPCSIARKRGSTSAVVTGRRQRPSAVVKARSSRPSRSSTTVEPCDSGSGRAVRAMVDEAPQRRSDPTPRPQSRSARASGEPAPQPSPCGSGVLVRLTAGLLHLDVP